MPAALLPIEALRPSLSEVLDDLCLSAEVAGRSPATLKLYRVHIRGLIAFCARDGVTTVEQLQTVHVTRYLASEAKRGLRPASIHVSLRTIRRFCQFAVSNDYVAKQRRPGRHRPTPRRRPHPLPLRGRGRGHPPTHRDDHLGGRSR